MRKEFHIEANRKSTVSFEPNFILQLDIAHEECTIENCLDNYFKEDPIEGFKLENGKIVKASTKFLFEKLPNILMLNLKRFIWHPTKGQIKKKEHVYFDEVLKIEDNHVSPELQIGIFKKASAHRNYRLYSIVEHIGNTGRKGHYVCYTLDSNNDWIKFDDNKWRRNDIKDIQNEVQAYMLWYELI